MTAPGTAAERSLSGTVAAVRRAEEKRLINIRAGIRKAIDAHDRELDRVLSGDKQINPRAYDLHGTIRETLVSVLHVVEERIQQHWLCERRSRGTPLDDLMEAVNEPILANLAKKYLAQRAKATVRDRRYRERKALPAPEPAAELANDPPAAAHAEETK
jgi:hypothetical protein